MEGAETAPLLVIEVVEIGNSWNAVKDVTTEPEMSRDVWRTVAEDPVYVRGCRKDGRRQLEKGKVYRAPEY